MSRVRARSIFNFAAGHLLFLGALVVLDKINLPRDLYLVSFAAPFLIGFGLMAVPGWKVKEVVWSAGAAALFNGWLNWPDLYLALLANFLMVTLWAWLGAKMAFGSRCGLGA